MGGGGVITFSFERNQQELKPGFVKRIEVVGWVGGWVDGWMDGWVDGSVRKYSHFVAHLAS